MTFLNIIKHLLPRGKAWRLTIDKVLKQFFDGLSKIGDDIKLFNDLIWFDIFPSTTREIKLWENQFGLRNNDLTEQERRDRLDATWKALGGQDPRYIQDILRGNGFDVYVHEWWSSKPAVGVDEPGVPRNPFLVLAGGEIGIIYIVEAGEALAEAGEALAEAGERLDPIGYPLVNVLFTTRPDVISLCGQPNIECGEEAARCGAYFGLINERVEYEVPIDQSTWPYFLYIGGVNFGDVATVDPKRKEEFEELCLKICPTQQWVGIIVQYQ